MDTKMVIREIDSLALDLLDLGKSILEMEEFAKEKDQEHKRKAESEGRRHFPVRESPAGGNIRWNFITRKFRNLVQAVGAEWPPEENPRPRELR